MQLTSAPGRCLRTLLSMASSVDSFPRFCVPKFPKKLTVARASRDDVRAPAAGTCSSCRGSLSARAVAIRVSDNELSPPVRPHEAARSTQQGHHVIGDRERCGQARRFYAIEVHYSRRTIVGRCLVYEIMGRRALWTETGAD